MDVIGDNGCLGYIAWMETLVCLVDYTKIESWDLRIKRKIIKLNIKLRETSKGSRTL